MHFFLQTQIGKSVAPDILKGADGFTLLALAKLEQWHEIYRAEHNNKQQGMASIKKEFLKGKR